MKKKTLMIILLLLVSISFSAYPWNAPTHEKITKQVEEERNVLQTYLVKAGFTNGRLTEFTLHDLYEIPTEIGMLWPQVMLGDEKRYSAIEWFVKGSVLEDFHTAGPLPLYGWAFNHFHDPTILGVG